MTPAARGRTRSRKAGPDPALADCVFYGVTGFTGRLAAEAARRLGMPMVLAGRNAESLRRVAHDFDDEYPVEVAAHDDPEGLVRVARSARVMVSTAGPFGEIGELPVAAAVAAGRHYLDSTGELDFMEQTFRRHHRAAREKELVVMNACAWEYVVGDCLTEIALADHPDASEMRVSYWLPDKTPTRGTATSAMRILSGRHNRGVSGRAMEVDFPAPAGRRWAVVYAGGEMEFQRRRRPGLRVTTLMDMPPAVARSARLAPGLLPLLGSRPVQAGLARLVRRMPEGPGPEQRQAQEWIILVEIDPGQGRRRGVYAHGVDPYGVTGEILARVARRVVRGEHRATGVVSPAEAFEPEELLTSLGDLGLEWARI